MMILLRASPFCRLHAEWPVLKTQSVELAQTSGNRPDATLSHGKQQHDHKIQHTAYKNDQELHVLIVAELSFHAHFVALPSLRFTYGNHAATLAGNTSPIDGPGNDRPGGRNTPSIAELIANLYYGEAGIMTNAADDFDALFEEVSAQRTSASPSPATACCSACPRSRCQHDEDDLDALFDQVSATAVPAAAAPAAARRGARCSGNRRHGARPPAKRAATRRMFERLGGIVRLLHDSLRELGYDKALTEASSPDHRCPGPPRIRRHADRTGRQQGPEHARRRHAGAGRAVEAGQGHGTAAGTTCSTAS